MRDAWRLAVGTFLVLPTAPPTRVDSRTAARAMLLAPATVLPSALVWAAIAAMVLAGLPPLVGAAVALSATALLSRAMHLDGLADTADGLASGYDRARALEVMKRGDTGPAGAAALVLVLLVQAAALAALTTSVAGTALAVTALVTSRIAPAVLCRNGIPSARPNGLGHGVAGSVGLPALGALVVTVLVAGTAVSWTLGIGPYAAGLVLVAGLVSAWFVARHVTRRLGGITGDVIGAAIELSLALSLAVASMVAPV